MHDEINPEVVELVSYNIYIFSEKECLCFFINFVILHLISKIPGKKWTKDKIHQILHRIF